VIVPKTRVGTSAAYSRTNQPSTLLVAGHVENKDIRGVVWYVKSPWALTCSVPTTYAPGQSFPFHFEREKNQM
jgi:hypothetical protein